MKYSVCLIRQESFNRIKVSVFYIGTFKTSYSAREYRDDMANAGEIDEESRDFNQIKVTVIAVNITAQRRFKGWVY